MKRRTRVALVLFGVFLSISAPVIGSVLLDSGKDAGQNVEVSMPNGPTVIVGESINFTNTNPWNESNTIILKPWGEFESQGNTSLRVTQFNGTWTNATNINATAAALTIRPNDKPALTVAGNVTAVAYRDDITLADKNTAFEYSASGSGNISINGLESTTDWGAVTATGSTIDSGTTTSSGTATVSVSSATNQDLVLFENSPPTASNFSPPDGEDLDSYDTNFTVDVTDQDFPQSDEVTAELYVDGTAIANKTVTSNTTVSITHQITTGGSHTYHWKLTDKYGGTTTTADRTINVPSEFSIYNISAPSQLVDNVGEIELTFYADDTVFTRTTSDGTVNLTGLPTNQELIVTASASGYYDRQTVILSLYEQQAIYLLNDTITAYNTKFILSDNTGGTFRSNEPLVIVERGLNKSGTTQWVSISGGEFGVSGYTTALEAGERYRLRVRNSLGDERVFYPYDAQAAETVPLEVGAVSASVEGEASYTWDAGYTNTSGTRRVDFEYIDELNATSSVDVLVYERGNKSNVLVNDTFTGTYGTLDLVWTVSNTTADGASFIVEYSAQRDGETVSGKTIVGPRQTVLEQLPVWLKTIISIGSVFIVAGLFSRANGAIGGIVTAAVGGMWWFVGFLPPEVGVGVVVLSFITAGMVFVRETGGVR